MERKSKAAESESCLELMTNQRMKQVDSQVNLIVVPAAAVMNRLHSGWDQPQLL